MGIRTQISGGRHMTNAGVSDNGELIVGPRSGSTFHLGVTIANNVAVNVVLPEPGQVFIITAIILSGDRSIGNDGAVTDIYENKTGPTDGTIVTQIIQEEIAKQTRMSATGLHITVAEGSWVNVKSDDVIVRCNIAGYYQKAPE